MSAQPARKHDTAAIPRPHLYLVPPYRAPWWRPETPGALRVQLYVRWTVGLTAAGLLMLTAAYLLGWLLYLLGV